MKDLCVVLDTLNGREQALISWVILIFGYCLINAKLRSSIIDIAKIIFGTKLFFMFAAMFVYEVLIVGILKRLGLWDISLLKEVVFWFFGTGLVLFMDTSKASGNPVMIKKMLLDSLTLFVVLEFIANLYSFDFIVEFLLVPILVLVTGVSVLADMKEEKKVLRKPAKILLSAYGFFLIFYSIKVALGDPNNFITLHNLLSFVISPTLTIAFVPLIYIFALVMAYESLFIRLSLFIKDDPKLLAFSRKKILLLCNFNLSKLNWFADSYLKKFALAGSKKEMESLVNEIS